MKPFYFFHAALFTIFAVIHVRNWIRSGFWFPRYVHILAFVSLLFGAWMMWFLQQPQYLQPGAKLSSMRYFVILMLPAIVYTVFVVYGGVSEAPERKREATETPQQTEKVQQLEQRDPFSDLRS